MLRLLPKSNVGGIPGPETWPETYHETYAQRQRLRRNSLPNEDFRLMLGGLNAIATLELFTQNYFKYDRISFTIGKRIKFRVYPPGARLSTPLPLFVQRRNNFEKIWIGSKI